MTQVWRLTHPSHRPTAPSARFLLPHEAVALVFVSDADEFIFTDRALVHLHTERKPRPVVLSARYAYATEMISLKTPEPEVAADGTEGQLAFSMGGQDLVLLLAPDAFEYANILAHALVALSKAQQAHQVEWNTGVDALVAEYSAPNADQAFLWQRWSQLYDREHAALYTTIWQDILHGKAPSAAVSSEVAPDDNVHLQSLKEPNTGAAAMATAP